MTNQWREMIMRPSRSNRSWIQRGTRPAVFVRLFAAAYAYRIFVTKSMIDVSSHAIPIACIVASSVLAASDVARAQMQNLQLDQRPGLTTDLQDPVVELQRIRQRRQIVREPADALFTTSPLTPVRKAFIDFEKRLYKETDLKLGTSLNHLLQGITDAKPGADDYGMSSFAIFTGTWDGWNKGCPCQGEVTISVEGRWNYGPPDPFTLGSE